MSDIKVLEQRALEIRRRYDELNKRESGVSWDAQKLANGFKKNVEDLIAIVSKKNIDRKKLEHELSDCLWSVLVISRKLDVDIERAFWATMAELDIRLDKGLA